MGKIIIGCLSYSIISIPIIYITTVLTHFSSAPPVVVVVECTLDVGSHTLPDEVSTFPPCVATPTLERHGPV